MCARCARTGASLLPTLVPDGRGPGMEPFSAVTRRHRPNRPQLAMPLTQTVAGAMGSHLHHPPTTPPTRPTSAASAEQPPAVRPLRRPS
jgi:hypothetical protein